MSYDTRYGRVLKKGPAKSAPALPARRLNRYICQTCKGQITTVDRDEGVTPFMLGCYATKGCEGSMYSSFYQVSDGDPTYEWRKASPEEYAAAGPAMRGHFDQGGLNIHPIAAKS